MKYINSMLVSLCVSFFFMGLANYGMDNVDSSWVAFAASSLCGVLFGLSVAIQNNKQKLGIFPKPWLKFTKKENK